RFGAFLFYASSAESQASSKKSANEKLERLVDKIGKLANSIAEKNGKVSAISMPSRINKGKERGDGAWCIGCVVFVKKGREQPFLQVM
ncbi:MAG: hypothetical protein WC722_01555, partial [Rhodospirillales bacterium]